MKKSVCMLVLLSAALCAKDSGFTEKTFAQTFTESHVVGVSPDGKLAYISASAGTVEPVGGSSMVLQIIDMKTSRELESVTLCEPGQDDGVLAPDALKKAVKLLAKHRIAANSVSQVSLPYVDGANSYEIADVKGKEIALLNRGKKIKSVDVSDGRKDPYNIYSSYLSANKRYLIVEYQRGEGAVRAEIAQYQWYYKAVLFDLKGK